MNDEIKLIHSFPKNALEEVRVYLSEYKRKPYLNLRVFYKAEDEQWKPTPKGLTLSVDLIDELVAAVAALRQEIDE